MRIAGIFIWCFLQIFFLKAQQPLSPVVNWQQRLGGSSDEAWESVCTAEDGSIVVCGYTSSTNGDAGEGQGGTDAWVAKFSSAGQLIWKKRYGGSKLDFANAVALGDGGGFIVAGVSYSNDGDVFENHGYSDAWLLKINDQGEKEWSCLYGGECFEEAVAVQRSVKGGYVVVGGTCSDGMMYQSEHRGLYDGWVFYIDRVGKMIWQHNVGGSGNDYLYHLDQGNNREWILSGETSSNDGDIVINNGKSDAWLVCMTEDGGLKWSRTYGGEGNDRFFSAHWTSTGNLLASGYIQRGTDFQGWILKSDIQGYSKKQAFYGGDDADYLVGSVLTNDGGGFFCGSTSSIIEDFSSSGNNGDAWLFKTDSNLNVQWQYVVGGEGADAFVGISFADNHRLFVAGYTSSSGENLPASYGMEDTWLISLIIDLVNEVKEPLQNYAWNIFPNPVSKAGVIYLSLKSGEIYTDLWILSSSGVVLKHYTNASNGLRLTMTGFSSGQYWMRLRDSKGRFFTRSFIVY